MTLREHILTTAQVYADATGRSMSRIATLVHSDGKFLSRLEAGGDVYTSSYERIMNWFVDNWPDDCDWPATVPRPGGGHSADGEAA